MLRVFSFLVFFFCTSCNELSFNKKRKTIPIDSVIDFSSVDFSPSFKICDSLIEKNKKTNCFRKTIHQEIAKGLAKHSIKINNPIDAIIVIKLQISPKGKISFTRVEKPNTLYKELPQLNRILKHTIADLPKVYPAIKRGIPVTAEYSLPIRILLQD